MVIKAVIFDCFGVLVMPGRTLLYQAFPEHKIEINDLERQSDYGMISRAEFNEAVAELVGVLPEEVKAKYYDTNVRNEPALAWIRELKQANYKIGLLSNVGRGWLTDYIPVDEQVELFDAITLSSNVGLIKPDPGIYQITARELGIEPCECVMVDDVLVNIEGASVADMRGFVYTSVEQAKIDLKHLIEIDNA